QGAAQVRVGVDDGVRGAFGEPEFVQAAQQRQPNLACGGFERLLQLLVKPVIEQTVMPADAEAEIRQQAALGGLQWLAVVCEGFAQAAAMAIAGEDVHQGTDGDQPWLAAHDRAPRKPSASNCPLTS